MRNALLRKLKQSSIAILPVTLLVVVLSAIFLHLDTNLIIQFLIASVLLIIGMAFFNLGADNAMLPIGQNVGSYLAKTHKIWLMLLCGLILGIIITVAEPDLVVLASQVPGLEDWVLIFTVAVGVGLFMVLAILRLLFQINLSVILFLSYTAIFVLAFFVPNAFCPLSFDSGSVTTGPISVPFLMAFGLGLAGAMGSKRSAEDSFGVIALGSAGPILAVMVLGCFLDPNTLSSTTTQTAVAIPQNFGEVITDFLYHLPDFAQEVAVILLPILVAFIIFQIFCLKLPMHTVGKILIGLFYVFFGITIFFTGVNIGFLPVGSIIGQEIAGSGAPNLLIPIALMLGFTTVMAEPAVYVLTKQVEQITAGKISRKTVLICLCIGVSCSVGLCALRVLFGFSFWWFIIPVYLISIILAFVVPKIYSGIAFDSGGVATGAMASTFVLPLIMGACSVLGGDIMTQGFGTVAYIAMTPLLTIQTLGLIVMLKDKHRAEKEDEEKSVIEKTEIVEFD